MNYYEKYNNENSLENTIKYINENENIKQDIQAYSDSSFKAIIDDSYIPDQVKKHIKTLKLYIETHLKEIKEKINEAHKFGSTKIDFRLEIGEVKKDRPNPDSTKFKYIFETLTRQGYTIINKYIDNTYYEDFDQTFRFYSFTVILSNDIR